jgi:hypothetical protein
MRFALLSLLLLITTISPLAQGQDVPPPCIGGTCVEGYCGLVDHPDCWVHRFACVYARGPTAYLFPESVCPQQPGCCNTTLDAVPSASGKATEPCTNYGVEVNLIVASHPCAGSCDNVGLEVNVIVRGSRCVGCENHGIVVSAGQSCGQDGIYACVGEVCTQPCGGGGCGTSQTSVSACGMPCGCDEQVVVALGLVSCGASCDSGLVSIVVGIRDCAACSSNGVQLFIGITCGRAGIGACIYDACFFVVDRGTPPKANR